MISQVGLVQNSFGSELGSKLLGWFDSFQLNLAVVLHQDFITIVLSAFQIAMKKVNRRIATIYVF